MEMLEINVVENNSISFISQISSSILTAGEWINNFDVSISDVELLIELSFQSFSS